MRRTLIALLFVPMSHSAATAQDAPSFGNGTHLVGTDIPPGIYRTEGEINYFARLSGLGGEFSDIIANEGSPPSPTLVEIKEDDAAFESDGPGIWVLLDDSYPAAQSTSFDDGWWLVGVDIQPGLYRTTDEVSYFARLSGLGAQFSDIIANEASTAGPVLVEIMDGDVAFQYEGAGIWTLIDDSYQPELKTSFGDGWWIVGVDIAPGLYRTEDDVSYYARLSGFGARFSDIISNEAGSTGSALIDIKPTDAGFQTSGGATWTKVPETPTAVEGASWGMVKAQWRR